jgi:membrane-associated phospholipid phosphatase
LVVYAETYRRLERGMIRKTLHSITRCSALYFNLIPTGVRAATGVIGRIWMRTGNFKMGTEKKLYQQTPEPIIIPLDWRDKSARVISNLFSPPLACIVVTALATKSESSLFWILIFIALLIIPPITVLTLVHRGKVSDFHLNIREERARPLFAIFAYAALIFLVMYFGGAPRLMLIVTAVALLQILLVFIITLKWKISGHCTSAAGLAFLAVALYGENVLPLTLIVPLIAWSRIRLGRHTISQTLAGSFLGAATVIIILYLTNVL